MSRLKTAATRALIIAALAIPLLGAEEAPPAPPDRVEGSQAWEVGLEALPAAPLRLVGAERAALLVPMPEALEARAIADGKLLWRRDGIAAAGLERVVPEGAVALGAVTPGDSPRFHVLDAATGKTLAEAALPAPACAAPLRLAAPPARWVVPLGSGRVLELGQDAAIRTEYRIDEGSCDALSEVAGRVVVHDDQSGRLYALGDPFERRQANDVTASTAASEGRWLYAARERAITAWRCRDNRRGLFRCRRPWRQRLGGAVTAPPLIGTDNVFVGSWDTFLYAFDRRNGHLVWRKGTGTRLALPPQPYEELVAVFAKETTQIRFHRASDGVHAGQIKGMRNELLRGVPTFGPGRLYASLLVLPLGSEPLSTDGAARSSQGDGDSAGSAFEPRLRAYALERIEEKKEEAGPVPAGPPGNSKPPGGKTE